MTAKALIRAIHPIEDAGPVIRFAPDADLDAVLLEALAAAWTSDLDLDGYYMDHEDYPTRITGLGPEALVGWFRMDPCSCGGEHNWHIRPLGEERPEGKIARGSWFGMWFEW